jgi:hypothetical protein
VAHSFDLLRAFYAAILHYLEKRLAGGTTTGLRVMHFVLSSPVLQKSPTYSSPTKHARSRRDFTGFRKKERTSAVGIVAEITLNEELKVWPLRCNYPVEKGACLALAAACGVTDLVRADMHFELAKFAGGSGNGVKQWGCASAAQENYMLQTLAGTLSN